MVVDGETTSALETTAVEEPQDGATAEGVIGQQDGTKPARKTSRAETALQEMISNQSKFIEQQNAMILQQTERFEAALRNTQGQVRSLETRLTQRSVADSPEMKILEGLDSDDPNVAKLVAIAKAQQIELATLREVAQGSVANTQAEIVRRQWIGYLEGQAKSLGVDFAEVRPLISSMDVEELSTKGLNLVIQTHTKALTAKQKADLEKELDKQSDTKANQIARDILSKKGIYQELTPTGTGGTGYANLTRAQLARMSPEEYAKNRDEILKHIGK